MALSDKIEIFCNEFIKTNNQRKAYKAAYPSANKWKPETIDSKASNFAKTDKVQTRLAKLRQEMATKNSIERSDLLDQLKLIGFADISHEAIKPSDKIKALELMAKMLGMDKPEGESSTENQVAETLRSIFGGGM